MMLQSVCIMFWWWSFWFYDYSFLYNIFPFVLVAVFAFIFYIRKTNTHLLITITYIYTKDAEDLGIAEIVSWSKEGTNFVIHDRDRFLKQVLRLYDSPLAEWYVVLLFGVVVDTHVCDCFVFVLFPPWCKKKIG